jgi:hypothetical protein
METSGQLHVPSALPSWGERRPVNNKVGGWVGRSSVRAGLEVVVKRKICLCLESYPCSFSPKPVVVIIMTELRTSLNLQKCCDRFYTIF